MEMKTYIAKRTEYVKTCDKIIQVAELLERVGSQLKRNRENFSFSNTIVSLPPEATRSRHSININSEMWPTAEKINQLISNWYIANSEMMSAWHILTDNEKSGMIPPPS